MNGGEVRATRLFAIGDRVTKPVAALRARGLTSPDPRPFVVARINPIRFWKAESFGFDEVLAKMQKDATKIGADRVKQEEIAQAGGGAPPARPVSPAPGEPL